jgi:hypothetical protein
MFESLGNIVAHAGPVVQLALLAGLVRRRLYRVCRTFPVYTTAVLAGEVLMLAWPERFHNWSFWTFKEAVYGLLKLGIALELASLTFRAFPGARATARRVLALGIGLLVTGLLALDLTEADEWSKLFMEIHPRLANGTALLFACIWGLVLWYNLPVHPFHRALLRGFVPYLLVYTVAFRLLAVWGWDLRHTLGFTNSAAYFLMLVYWTVVAWRPQAPPPADPALVHRLQPWRDTL